MTEDLSTQTKPTSRSQLVVTRKNDIQGIENDIKKMLPPSVPSDKFVRTVQTAITLNPDLAEADKNSVLTSCMKAAADGLVLDGREAALVIYNTKVKRNGKDEWVKAAQYIPMVAGIIKRVRNSGEVSRLNAFVVYENDVFHVAYGLEMTLKHEPNFENPGKAIGTYAVCLFKDGEVDFEYMSAAQIKGNGAQGKNAAQYDSGTGKNYGEWWRKTAIRRLSKRLPVNSDIASVIERIDEDYDFKPTGSAAIPAHDADGVVIENEPAEKSPTKRKGAAAEKLNPKASESQPAAEPVEQESIDADSVGASDDLDDIFE